MTNEQIDCKHPFESLEGEAVPTGTLWTCKLCGANKFDQSVEIKGPDGLVSNMFMFGFWVQPLFKSENVIPDIYKDADKIEDIKKYLENVLNLQKENGDINDK
jgi:hypothetical protein